MNKFFVDVNWLKDHLNESNLVILDMPYGMNEYIKEDDNEKREYNNEHIPRAIKIDKEELQGEDSDLNLYEADKLKDVFLKKGIDCKTLLVVYSDGIIASSRVALAAYWLGVDNVKILLGGINSWKNAGFEVTAEIKSIVPKTDFGCKVPRRPEFLISTPAEVIKEQSENPNFVLANIRSWEEYIGTKSGYPYIKGTGSPLGSVYAKASTDRVNVEYILSEEGNFCDLDQLFTEWKQWGITKDKEVALFCGAGWRAAAIFFILKENGWANIKVYDGGWYQWTKYHNRDPKRYKIQVGSPKTEEGINIIGEE
ncbi:sulfurtransferase [Facklamia sp. DSM 111018]|uniref:Sulfurtransferase n=1 Tax=Facklamia lactis TaxID=2749967 RepID=A0ABS0LQE3_9LACT|nr:rhodanese-like domain-containing protein [Facklamia lactis]MBG9986369.1 sulfurtransferase [Facklamia lactis]